VERSRSDDALPALPGGGLRLESAAAGAAEPAGAGGRKAASERRGLGALRCCSNAFPGRSPRGPPCPAAARCVERLVCAEPGGPRAELSGRGAELLRCRWVPRVGTALPRAGGREAGRRSPVPQREPRCVWHSLPRPTSCRFQGGQQEPGPIGASPPGRLSPGKRGAAPAHLPFARSRAGVGEEPRSFGIPALCRVGLGRPAPPGPSQGGSWGSSAWPRRGGDRARGTELFAVGRSRRPRWRKKHFRDTLRSGDLPRTVVLRVCLYPSVRVHVHFFPADRWGGSGWQRVAGRSRRGGKGAPASAPRRRGGVGG